MPKRRGVLDYVLAGLTGGMQGYGQLQERKRLEAAQEEERRIAQEERDRGRMIDALKLAELGGGFGDIPSRTTYTPELRRVTPDVSLREDMIPPLSGRGFAEDARRSMEETASRADAAMAMGRLGRRPIDRAFETAVVPQTAPDADRYQALPGGAYIVRPEIMRREQAERAAAQASEAARQGMQLSEEQKVFQANRLRQMGVSEDKILETVYGVKPTELERPSAPPSRIQEIEALSARFPDMDPEDIAEMVYGRRPGAVQQPRIPASTMEKIATNNSILESISNALSNINPDTEDAFGLRFSMPLTRTFFERGGTPEEQMMRAQIANIGSQLLAARSGAAISSAEFERLSPFVPAISDSPNLIRSKLNSLSRELQRINRATYDVYQGAEGPSPQGGVTEGILNEYYR